MGEKLTMKLFCGICKKPVVSMKLKPEEAIGDLTEILIRHVKASHTTEAKEHENLLGELQVAVTNLPLYVSFLGLVDWGNETTSPEVIEMFDELEEKMIPLIEVFGEDSNETEKDELKDKTEEIITAENV